MDSRGGDGEETAAYVQAAAFNVPLLEGWENQSTEQVAQFHLGSSRATIRTALVPLADPLAAVEKELLETFDLQPGRADLSRQGQSGGRYLDS